MKELIIYQLEVAFCLFALTLLYFVFWKKETNFQLKRAFILSIPILAFIIPWLDFNITLSREQTLETIQYFAELPTQFIVPDIILNSPEFEAESMSIWQIIFWVWLSGIIAMTIRVSVSYYNIWKIYRNSVKPIGSSYRVVNEPIQSFSFFSFIALNKHHENCKVRDYILAHERAHSQQLHSLDVILFETLKILQWFNPAFWMLTKELKLNLEYLADQAASDITNNTQKYQFSIIHHASLSRYQLLKSEFSKSNLKNRIIMMNQHKNKKIHSIKLLVFIPILSMLFMSFSLNLDHLDIRKEMAELMPILSGQQTNSDAAVNLPSIQKQDIKQIDNAPVSIKLDTTTKVDDKVYKSYEVFKNRPTPISGANVYKEIIHASINFEYIANKNNTTVEKIKERKGQIFVRFIVQKDGSLTDIAVQQKHGMGPGFDEEAVRIIKEGPKWAPGKRSGEPVAVAYSNRVYFGMPLPHKRTTRLITGTVKSKDGKALAGANILIKGTVTGTITNLEGEFKLDVKPEDQSLIVNYVGYNPQHFLLTEDYTYEIRLKETNNDYKMDIIGYEDPEENSIETISTKIDSHPIPSTGDINSYYKVINSKLVYPEKAKRNNIKGKVFLQFIVQKDGSLSDVKAGKGLGYGCDEAAVKVVKEGPRWIAGTENGEPIDKNIGLIVYFGIPQPIFNEKTKTTRIITGSVNTKDGLPIPGANVIIVGTKTGTVTDEKGIYRLKLESNHKELIVSRNGYNSKLVNTSNPDEFKKVELQKYTDHTEKEQEIVIKGSNRKLSELQEEDRPLLIMDKKEVEFDMLKDINPNEIESISVLKDESATKKYGEKGKNGVIIITTKE